MAQSTFAAEKDLLAGLRAGDEGAFAQLVRQNAGPLRSVAGRILRNSDDADDAVQESFLCVFLALTRFEGQSSLATWLHSVAVNQSLMMLRSRSRRQARFLKAIPYQSPEARRGRHLADEVHARMENKEAKERIRSCIRQLSEKHQQVLMLRDIEEVDTKRAAAILGVQPGAVKTRLHRARQALRSLLAPFVAADGA